MITAKPYRYQGRQGWDPAGAAAPLTQSQQRDLRAAEFARLRAEEGLTIAGACRRLGVNRGTGYQYERARLRGAQ